MAISTASKVLFAVGAIFTLVGIILLIVTFVTAGNAVNVKFLAKGKTDFKLKVDRDDHCGFTLFMSGNENCEQVASELTIKGPEGMEHPDGGITFFPDAACPKDLNDWAKKDDLHKVGHFFIPEKDGVQVKGDYNVKSSDPLWTFDACKEAVGAVTGLFAALGLLIVSIVLMVIGLILLCVGCCCMNK